MFNHTDKNMQAKEHDQEYNKAFECNVIKVSADHVLNEEGYAISPGGYNNVGFSYQVKPLSTNLSQSGNDGYPASKNKSFKHFVGDMIKGQCPYDKKIHKGMIKHLYYVPGSDETEPKFVYIQDFETNTIIPVLPDTVRIEKNSVIKPEVGDYLSKHGAEVDHDLDRYSPAIESSQFDFNSILNEDISNTLDDFDFNAELSMII